MPAGPRFDPNCRSAHRRMHCAGIGRPASTRVQLLGPRTAKIFTITTRSPNTPSATSPRSLTNFRARPLAIREPTARETLSHTRPFLLQKKVTQECLIDRMCRQGEERAAAVAAARSSGRSRTELRLLRLVASDFVDIYFHRADRVRNFLSPFQCRVRRCGGRPR